MFVNMRRLLPLLFALAIAVMGNPLLGDPDDASGSKTKQPTTRKSTKVDMTPIESDEAAERAALEQVGPGFSIKHTSHYAVIHNTTKDEVSRFSAAIEGTYRSCMNYVERLGLKAEKPGKKLIIFYFNEHKEYSAFSKKLNHGERPQWQPGVYFTDLNRSLFYNFRNQDSFKAAILEAEKKLESIRTQLKAPGLTAARRKQLQAEMKNAQAQINFVGREGGDLSEGTVQHEVSHQVLWNVGYHHKDQFWANPRWLAEGTAQMFETLADGGGANFGAVNTERLRQYRDFEKNGQLFPLRSFISTHAHFNEKTMGVSYAQSWALAHYLNRTKRRQLKTYVEIILKRPKDYKSTEAVELADFEKAFGKTDERWERTWKDWMKKVR